MNDKLRGCAAQSWLPAEATEPSGSRDLLREIGACAAAAATAVGEEIKRAASLGGGSPQAALYRDVPLEALVACGVTLNKLPAACEELGPRPCRPRHRSCFSFIVRTPQQGLNVVIAAVDDELLVKAAEDLREQFPECEFRAVGVNLSAAVPTTYLSALDSALSDIEPSVIFLNAGYMVSNRQP